MKLCRTIARTALGLGLLAILSACADPAAVARIRPGIGSDVDLDAIRPPSGVTYNFAVEQGGFAIPAAISLTSRRKTTKVYDYNGAMVIQVPGDAATLAEVAKDVRKVFKVQGPRIRGNKIFIPLNIRTDNRFRATSSSLLAAADQFSPNDCFAQLGTCRYTATSADGTKLDFISETSEQDGIWRTVTRADMKTAPKSLRGVREVMTYSIDSNAIIIDLAINEFGAGQKDISVFKRQ